ncbi:hypothetical protein ACWD1Y_22050 [Streptomyces sp. NPDC002814]
MARHGVAAKVLRMVPVPYSPAITRAPTTAAGIWAVVERVRLS